MIGRPALYMTPMYNSIGEKTFISMSCILKLLEQKCRDIALTVLAARAKSPGRSFVIGPSANDLELSFIQAVPRMRVVLVRILRLMLETPNFWRFSVILCDWLLRHSIHNWRAMHQQMKDRIDRSDPLILVVCSAVVTQPTSELDNPELWSRLLH